jgi:putative dehydrogenase
MNKEVGILGLGIMGSAMSKNLLDAGFKVIGYDLLPHKLAELEAAGGQAAVSAAEVAGSCDVVISVLPTIESVLDSAEVLSREGRAGLTLIECSTMPLDTKEAARKLLEGANMKILDCPLSGTGAQAVNKDLSVYASGDRTVYEQCVPVFLGFARSHYLVGDFGAGTKMKFVANLLVAIHNVSAAEAFVLGMKAGLDPEMILKVVGDGAGSSLYKRPSKKSFPLSSMMIKAGKSLTVILKMASMPNSGYSRVSTAVMHSFPRRAAAPPMDPR